MFKLLHIVLNFLCFLSNKVLFCHFLLENGRFNAVIIFGGRLLIALSLLP